MGVLKLFHRQVLVFGALVPLLMAGLYLIGFASPSIAWYASLSIVVLGSYVLGKAVEVNKANLLFAVFLFVLWGSGNLLLTTCWDDTLTCHLPAIRMMALGWNPVQDGTLDGISSAMGINTREMLPWHIISGHKGVWYFCASAYHFIGNPHNLLWPAAFVLFVSLTLTVFQAFKNLPLIARALIVLIIVRLSPDFLCCVDLVVAYSGIGCLICMWKYLRGEEIDSIEFGVYAYWMCVAKPSGLLHFIVFGFVFLSALFVKKHRFSQGALVKASIVLAAVALTLASPYLTSYNNFKHPLYPKLTSDSVLYPSFNLTNDFEQKNDDLKAMSHVGGYINAFVSSDLTKAYYKHKLHQEKFSPSCQAWGAKNYNGTPTPVWTRCIFVFSICCVFLLGSNVDRLVLLIVAIGMAALPTSMVGYIRYVPWWFFGTLLSIDLLFERYSASRLCSVLQGLALASAFLCLIPILFVGAIFLGEARALNRALAENPPVIAYAGYGDKINTWRDRETTANLELVKRMDNRLSNTAVIRSRTRDNAYWFDYSFCIDANYDLTKYSQRRKIIAEPDRLKRVISWLRFVLKTYLFLS